MKILSAIAAIFFTALVTAAQTPAPPPPPKTTVIHAGHLIAEPGKPATTNQSILIQDGKITFVMKEGQVFTGQK
jgi:hypothetical protein